MALWCPFWMTFFSFMFSNLITCMYSWGIFSISETFSKSGDPLKIGIYYLLFVSHSGNWLWILTRVIIQRWVMAQAVIQPLNHLRQIMTECVSHESVYSYHGLIYSLLFPSTAKAHAGLIKNQCVFVKHGLCSRRQQSPKKAILRAKVKVNVTRS